MSEYIPCVVITARGVFYAEHATISGIFIGDNPTELTVLGHSTIRDPFKPPIRRLDITHEDCEKIIRRLAEEP